MPELNLHCLRLASNSPKVRDTLLKLDEQGVSESEPMITHGHEAFRTTLESSKDVLQKVRVEISEILVFLSGGFGKVFCSHNPCFHL